MRRSSETAWTVDPAKKHQDAATRRKGWFRSKRETTVGAAPGTLIQDPCAPQPVLRVIAYGPDDFLDRPVEDPGELPELIGQRPVTWLNVDGHAGTLGIARSAPRGVAPLTRSLDELELPRAS